MNLKNNAIVFLFSRGWQYAGRCRPLLVVYIIMFALAKGIELTEPYVIGRMLNDIQVDLGGGLGNTNKILSDVGRYLLLLGAISLGLWAMHGPARIIEQFVAFQIRSNFKSDLFRRLTCLPMRWQREHHSGESIDKINNATAAMSAFFQTTFWLVYMAVRITGTLAILFCLMPIAGWAAVFTTVLAIMTIALFDKVLGEQLCELNRKDNLVASAIHDYASNITSVITLRLEKRTFDEVRRRVFSSQRLFTKNAALTELKWAIISLQVTAVTLIVMFLYVHSNLSARHLILAGTFFTLFEYMRSLGVFYDAFANIYGTIDRQAAALRSVDTINEAYNASDLTENNADLPRSWKEIEVRNLNFTYEDEKCKSHHLNDLCIKLEKGKSIAIVGESGSGKSTLLSVLRGLQKPEVVEVLADGVKLPQDLRHLSHSTTLLPQDPEIFADTIRFNISFGVEADDDELMSVLQLSKFDSVLARLPDGLNTNIAEKGVNLSGGEKQRLALARGLFFAKDSDIILLDEPTSSVDVANEKEIYNALLKQFSNQCVVSSLHKLHLLSLFDKVYVLADGKLVETGTFKTLVEQNGVLANMWKNYLAGDHCAATDDSNRFENVLPASPVIIERLAG